MKTVTVYIGSTKAGTYNNVMKCDSYHFGHSLIVKLDLDDNRHLTFCGINVSVIEEETITESDELHD